MRRRMTYGLGPGCLKRLGKRRWLYLVGLGQHQMITDGGGVEHRHHVAVDVLSPMSALDEDQRALQHAATAQIVVDQEAPLADEVLGRLGETVTRHVDQPQLQRPANVEEIELLRPARRVSRPSPWPSAME